MHVCEQRRELEECKAEHGMTPIHLLADHGILSERFVGVHANFVVRHNMSNEVDCGEKEVAL